MVKVDNLMKKLSDAMEFIKIYDAYIAVIIIMLLYIGLTIWFMQLPFKDIVTSLFAGAIDVIITIILLIIFIDMRERWKWKSVSDTVYESLGNEIHDLFTDLSNLCRIDETTGNINFYTNEDENLLNGGYGELFIYRKDHIKDLEQKYFKFLEPSIIISLIKIQKCLYSLDIIIRIRNRNRALNSPYTRPDADILEYLKVKMIDIFREIGSLRNESNLKNFIQETPQVQERAEPVAEIKENKKRFFDGTIEIIILFFTVYAFTRDYFMEDKSKAIGALLAAIFMVFVWVVVLRKIAHRYL
jgi:hypothetical protein